METPETGRATSFITEARRAKHLSELEPTPIGDQQEVKVFPFTTGLDENNVIGTIDIDTNVFDEAATPEDAAMWVAANVNVEAGSRNEDRFRYFNAENHHPAVVPLVVHTNFRAKVKGVVAYRTTDPKGNEITIVTSFAPTESFDIIKAPTKEDVAGLLTRVGHAHKLGEYINHWSAADLNFVPQVKDIQGNMNDPTRKLHLHPRIMLVKGEPTMEKVWLLMRER